MIEYIYNFVTTASNTRLAQQVKTALNIILVASLSSPVFKYYYFDYTLLDISDYQGYYDFFVDGHFFIPLTLFFLIWYVTDFTGTLIFQLPNTYLESKLKRWSSSLTRKSFSFFDNATRKKGEKKLKKSSNNWLLDTFFLIRKSMDLKRIQKTINSQRGALRKEFVLIFRLFVVMIIYFVNLTYFGGWWFFFLCFLLFLAALRASFAYQFIEIRPVFIKKIDQIKKEIKDDN